jgi:hypothetical protein
MQLHLHAACRGRQRHSFSGVIYQNEVVVVLDSASAVLQRFVNTTAQGIVHAKTGMHLKPLSLHQQLSESTVRRHHDRHQQPVR